MPSKILKPQIVPNNPKVNKSHSNNKFAANALRKSDDKECEQSEKLYPLKSIIGIKSSNQHKYLKLGAKTKIPEYKYSPQKNNSLFCPKFTQNPFTSE